MAKCVSDDPQNSQNSSNTTQAILVYSALEHTLSKGRTGGTLEYGVPTPQPCRHGWGDLVISVYLYHIIKSRTDLCSPTDSKAIIESTTCARHCHPSATLHSFYSKHTAKCYTTLSIGHDICQQLSQAKLADTQRRRKSSRKSSKKLSKLRT